MADHDCRALLALFIIVWEIQVTCNLQAIAFERNV
jgi:hypothetical protein